MPAAVAAENENAKTEQQDQMWKVLKAHILRERARKRQEREAEVEEERLRKEQEAREQQNVMTLGETREQISQLEAKLQQLKEEKHQLFLQLKKVLNEDDNRRRQLVKENSEMIAFQSLPQGFPPQLYISPTVARQPQVQPQQQPPQSASFKQPSNIKRPRSPSPQPPVSVSIYHQGYGYKPPQVNAGGYQTSPQKDDGRRHELVRAVLWNKTPQYANQPGAYYPMPPSELSIYYPPLASREPPPQSRSVYEPARPQPSYHLEQQKINDHYNALRGPPSSSHAHVIHHALNPAQPISKTGSITAGYPVRSQSQYQQVPTAAPALYTAQSRPLYQSPGTPMNYPTRD